MMKDCSFNFKNDVGNDKGFSPVLMKDTTKSAKYPGYGVFRWMTTPMNRHFLAKSS
jgi:hypothetical protein